MKLNILYLINTAVKTVYVNFHCLPVKDAIKLPIWIAGDVKLGKLGTKGCLKLGLKKPGVVRFGFGGSFNLGTGGYFHVNGSCLIHGRLSCGRGIQFLVGAKAIAEFGDNFEANSNCIINAGNKKMFVGNDVIFGWGTTVLAANGHKIISQEGENTGEGNIYIGNHVWLCSDVKCLSGTKISDDSVVAANAIVTREFSESNLLIGGNNKILKHHISWEK